MINPHFSDFNQNESVDFLRRFDERICEEASKELYGTKKAFDVVAHNISRLMNAYLPSNEVIASAKIANKDLKRDSCIVFFRLIVSAFRSFYEEAPRQAAERLYNCMIKYDERIDKLNYVSETAALANFCMELTTEPQLVEDVEALHLTQVVQDMITANNEFDDLYNERLDQREKHDEVTFAADLVKAVSSCRSFYNMIATNVDLYADIDFAPLVKKLTLLAEDYNQIADKRIAIAKANKQRDKDEPSEQE